MYLILIKQSSSQVRLREHSAGVSVLDSDVSVLTPSGTPRVLDEPETVIETEGGDSVVGLGSAVVEDTTLVLGPV
jgi:hypothetical protein